MIQMSFSSAHVLRNYVGKCANLHGHNYRVEVYVRGHELDKAEMLADFAEIKASTRRLVDYLDPGILMNCLPSMPNGIRRRNDWQNIFVSKLDAI